MPLKEENEGSLEERKNKVVRNYEVDITKSETGDAKVTKDVEKDRKKNCHYKRHWP